jgi:phenylpropionate dioxygenase-like ring-hydroxylating dioxygenase large terminal subunit
MPYLPLELTMRQPEQIALLKRLLHFVETKTTCMAETPYRNPVTTYTDPARLQREQRELFHREPLLIGFASELARPGDYKTDDYSGVPILVVRGRDGRLRAFLNVCRHRGAKVVAGCGSARVFSCPYHAWTYDLAGQVTHIPEERCFPDVKAERPSLAPLPLCEKHGLVWVIAMPAADGATSFDVDAWLGAELADELEAYNFAVWPHYETRVLHKKMNWKLAIDTFHEGYHIGALHRKTIAPLFVNAVDFKAFGPHLRMSIARSKIIRLKDKPESEWDAMWNTALVYTMLPNAVLVMNGDHAELWRIFPEENQVDRSVVALSFYIPKPVASDEEKRHWDANVDLTMLFVEQEDFAVGESIQAGFLSGAQSHTVYGQNEPALIHFHRSLHQMMGPSAHSL